MNWMLGLIFAGVVNFFCLIFSRIPWLRRVFGQIAISFFWSFAFSMLPMLFQETVREEVPWRVAIALVGFLFLVLPLAMFSEIPIRVFEKNRSIKKSVGERQKGKLEVRAFNQNSCYLLRTFFLIVFSPK